jgi:hypothetical protein
MQVPYTVTSHFFTTHEKPNDKINISKYDNCLANFRFSVRCIFYRLQINVLTDVTNFISLFLMFHLTLHVSGLYWSIIRGVLICCYATIWLLSCLFTVRASLEVALSYSTDTRTVNKYDKRQMVA